MPESRYAFDFPSSCFSRAEPGLPDRFRSGGRTEAASICTGRDVQRSNERPAHRLTGAKPAIFGDDIDPIGRFLEPTAGGLDTSPRNEAGRRESGLTQKDA